VRHSPLLRATIKLEQSKNPFLSASRSSQLRRSTTCTLVQPTAVKLLCLLQAFIVQPTAVKLLCLLQTSSRSPTAVKLLCLLQTLAVQTWLVTALSGTTQTCVGRTGAESSCLAYLAPGAEAVWYPPSRLDDGDSGQGCVYVIVFHSPSKDLCTGTATSITLHYGRPTMCAIPLLITPPQRCLPLN
jgi:hypothetical protein